MDATNNFAHTDLEVYGYAVKVTQVRAERSDHDGDDIITAVSVFDDITEEAVTLVLSESERDELVASLTQL